MGLALYNTPDALDLSQRYLSHGPSQVSRPRPRAHYNGAYYHPDGSIVLHRELADLKLPLLDLVLLANHQAKTQRHRRSHRRQTSRLARQWCIDEANEGRALARGPGQALPGPHRRLPPPGEQQRRRTPSLERQEAFRDVRTAKSILYPQDAHDISELYRLGLLYDDEYLRGPGFDFDAIDRSEPEYTIRPAKQTRKTKRSRIPRDDNLQFALDLSLAELGRDESSTQFLGSPEFEDSSSDAEANTGNSNSNSHNSSYGARLAPLHLVAELMQPPEDFSSEGFGDDTTPDMTTDSEGDSESVCSSSNGRTSSPSRSRTRRGRSHVYGLDDEMAGTWKMLNDGL
ncbi:hypothetical protein CDEST_01578 [Colletotrichum destructivum]|uniref:Uncharacterized protein n=1 Tax=Colletotrichum destructivum TaxID=34406 RepID=A0AAX4HZL4_9PEZI|nr:hypothetical protein CDEST_01578 [Colletotrichum destructivum]